MMDGAIVKGKRLGMSVVRYAFPNGFFEILTQGRPNPKPDRLTQEEWDDIVKRATEGKE